MNDRIKLVKKFLSGGAVTLEDLKENAVAADREARIAADAAARAVRVANASRTASESAESAERAAYWVQKYLDMK